MNKGFADLCLTTWLRRRKQKKAETWRIPIFSCSFQPEPQISGCNTENQKLKIDSSFFRLDPLNWSGRRDLNSRPSPWQGDALPLSYSRFSKTFDSNDWDNVVKSRGVRDSACVSRWDQVIPSAYVDGTDFIASGPRGATSSA